MSPLRLLMIAAVVASPTFAHADKQLDDLKVMYEKEVAGCGRSRDGLAKVVDGATELQKSIPATEKPDLDKDIDTLSKGLVVVRGYCAELDGALEVLRANPTAKYRTLERDLDERDNRIRKGRAASKKILLDTEPISRRLIPKINAARVSAPAPNPDKGTPAKFPSGRTVELPAIVGGTWKIAGSSAIDTAEFADAKSSISLSTRSFANATCDQQKRIATMADDTNIMMVEGDPAKPYAWLVKFSRKARSMQIACAMIGDNGGIIATLDSTDVKFVDAGVKVLAKMTAVRLTDSGK